MSHDRGCSCGKEKWDYHECYKKQGDKCLRAHTVLNWIRDEKSCNLNKENTSVRELAGLCENIETLIQNKKWSELDEMMDQNWQEFAPVIMTGLLRYTFCIRSKLSNWETALDKIAKELYHRGKDIDQELRGLF